MKTIVFKEPFESKLKELKVKGKFVKNFVEYQKTKNRTISEAIKHVNQADNFAQFVAKAFIWADTPEKHNYWMHIGASVHDC